MRDVRRVLLFAVIGCAVAAVLALCGCSTVSSLTDPVQPTGPYSTRGIGGPGCVHSGPGWVKVVGSGKVYHVRDAYYCAMTTDTAVVLASGRRFDLRVPWMWSRAEPGPPAAPARGGGVNQGPP